MKGTFALGCKLTSNDQFDKKKVNIFMTREFITFASTGIIGQRGGIPSFSGTHRVRRPGVHGHYRLRQGRVLP
jgi:hypothetical protein